MATDEDVTVCGDRGDGPYDCGVRGICCGLTDCCYNGLKCCSSSPPICQQVCQDENKVTTIVLGVLALIFALLILGLCTFFGRKSLARRQRRELFRQRHQASVAVQTRSDDDVDRSVLPPVYQISGDVSCLLPAYDDIVPKERLEDKPPPYDFQLSISSGDPQYCMSTENPDDIPNVVPLRTGVLVPNDQTELERPPPYEENQAAT